MGVKSSGFHLHTLPGMPGGVINVFNLTDGEQTFEFDVLRDVLGIGATQSLQVTGARATWHPDRVALRVALPPMSPAVIPMVPVS